MEQTFTTLLHYDSMKVLFRTKRDLYDSVYFNNGGRKPFLIGLNSTDQEQEADEGLQLRLMVP